MITRISDMIPGYKMCAICFEAVPVDDVYTDRHGDRWDMCVPCGTTEDVYSSLKKAGYTNEQVIDAFKIILSRR